MRPCLRQRAVDDGFDCGAIGHVETGRLRFAAPRTRSRRRSPRRSTRARPRRPSRPAQPASLAMAAPMPRDAPVTSATLPVRSSITCSPHTAPAPIEIVRRSDGGHCASRWILRMSPLKHSARTHFNIRGDAIRRKAPDAVFPSHRRRHLAYQRLDSRRAVALGRRVDVGDDRNARDRESPARAAPARDALRPASSARSETAR